MTHDNTALRALLLTPWFIWNVLLYLLWAVALVVWAAALFGYHYVRYGKDATLEVWVEGKQAYEKARRS